MSSDSLGHIVAAALGKKVIGLYGPTNARRMSGVKEIETVISTLNCPHMPCYLPDCKFSRFCMSTIAPQKVAEVCERFLQ